MRDLSLRRKVAAFVCVIAVCTLVVEPRTAMAADDEIAFSYKVDASTHLKTLDQDITVPTGTFVGAVRISDGALTGSIDLPPAQFTFRVAGIVPLVTATAQIVEAQPVTGTLDYWSHYPDLVMTATATINLRIVSAYAPGIPLNLVGSRCTTATPMEVTMSGNANLSGPSTLTGVYTIPPFKTCGNLAVTTALNLTVSGPGNTFTATATP